MVNLNQTGSMFIFSAPSGGGKSTIIKKVLEKLDNIELSVSATTREKREGEENGKDYYFISKENFDELINQNAFYEFVDSDFGPKYGTPRAPVDDILKQGKDVILDLDYPGVQQLRALAKDKVTAIFIMPPSIEELRRRLVARGTDKPEVIEHRMSMAEKRIKESKFYDYIVLNDNLDVAVDDVCKIIREVRAKKESKKGVIGR